MERETIDLRILYVEDDPEIRSLVVKFLERHCDRVAVAENGQEGLNLYHDFKPELVITDIRMPVMDGLAMVEGIRNADEQIPVIITTAHSETKYMVEAIKLGVQGFLLKPIRLKKLHQMLLEQAERVTLKRRSEEQLRLLGEYKKVVDAGSIVSITDAKGRITYVNDEFCRITEYSEKELIGKTHRIIRHPSMSDDVFKEMWSTLMDKRIFKGIIESRTKSEGSFIADVTIVPILDVNDQVTEMVAMRHNITSFKDADEKNIKSIFQGDTNMVLVLNEFYQPVMMNEKLLACLGAPDMESFYGEGRCLLELFAKKEGFFSAEMIEGDDCQDKRIDFVRRVKEGRKGQYKILMENRKKGEERIFTPFVNSVISNLFKQRIYHIISFADVTELERMREKEVENVKLASIGKLSAGITHEINTPLTYIKGNLELLKFDIEDIQDEKLRQSFTSTMDTVDEGVGRISNIIESMKEIAGMSKDNREEANLYRAVIYSCRMIYNRAKHVAPIFINGKPFTMDLDKDEESYPAHVSMQRIEQVWIILLNNALDEFHKSPLPFEDRWIKVDISETNGTVVVTIHDNAGGIPETVLPTIFQPFKSTKVHSGMGIGLNIAKAIVTNHDGQIRAYNEGDGAVFEIVIKKEK